MTQPPAEVVLTLPRVRRLLETQHPDLAGQELRIVGEGWDHLMVRVGEALVARLPRREVAVPLLRNEREWLPRIAQLFPLPVPVPIRHGAPGEGFPWPWSLVPWIPGRTVDREPLDPPALQELALGLRKLHARRWNAPANAFRQVALAERSERVEQALEALGASGGSATGASWVDPGRCRAVWTRALDAGAPPYRCWIHGDLHGLNVLGSRGEITGVIDWGDFTSGDPATDVAAAWLVARGPRAREVFLGTYAPDPGTLARARGWALLIGLLLLGSGEERHEGLGRAVLVDLLLPPSGGLNSTESRD